MARLMYHYLYWHSMGSSKFLIWFLAPLAHFNIHQHLARGNISFDLPGAHMLLNWSKTLLFLKSRVGSFSFQPSPPPNCARYWLCSAAYPSQPIKPFFTLPRSATPIITPWPEGFGQSITGLKP